MEMNKETTYLIGKIGTVLCLVSIVCGITGFKIWSDEIILLIATIVFGIGFLMVLVPVIFGHLPRKNESLDINYLKPPSWH